jgi:hypothetical protein
MSSVTFQLASQLEEAFNAVGASMMSDEFAGKLLAYVYVMGGGNEAVVYNEALNAGIAIAAQKFNIKGGEMPKAKSIPIVRAFIHELERKGEDTPWLERIYSRYNISRNQNVIKNGK